MKNLVLLGLVALAPLTLAAAIVQTNIDPQVPQCQEDQTLVGEGDFQNGRWTAYACGPAVDDLTVTLPAWTTYEGPEPVWVCDPRTAGDYDVDNLSALDIEELQAVALDPTNDYAAVCR